MKWETVKSRVAAEVHSAIIQGRSWETMATILVDFVSGGQPKSPISSRESFKLYADKAAEVINNWDIRCAGKLRDLFPGAFPKSLSKGQLVGEHDASGEWVLNVRKGGPV